jgi:hypothetical protein
MQNMSSTIDYDPYACMHVSTVLFCDKCVVCKNACCYILLHEAERYENTNKKSEPYVILCLCEKPVLSSKQTLCKHAVLNPRLL